jgi:hypothetical protein
MVRVRAHHRQRSRGTPEADRPAAVKLLARSAGLNPAVSARYVSLLLKMREICGEIGVPEDELLSPSFNSQEIAARIYTRSKTVGARALRDLADNRISLPALRDTLGGIPVPSEGVNLRSAISTLRQASLESLETALKRDGRRIFGHGALVRRRPKLQFIGNLGYEIIGSDGAIAAGVDIMFPDDRLGHDFVERYLRGSLALAPFFPKFYIAFPRAEQGDHARRVVEVLEWMRYDWIGVLQVSAEAAAGRGPRTNASADA